MRVIAGSAGGIRLDVPKTGIRPTMDRVKAAIFSSLGEEIIGANVLDLFAGTGALGIEALSRGADHATFVESGRHALFALRDNLDATGFADRATVLPVDATKAELPAVDLAFADPPYAFTAWHDLLTRVDADVVVIESDREIDPADPWRVLRQKRYGTTVVTLTSPRSNL